MKTTMLFVLLEDRIENTAAPKPWTVIDRHGVECGRYEFGDAHQAADTLNGPLGSPAYQPYTVAWAGDDRRSGSDRRSAA